MALLISVLEQGLIYAIMAFGIYITYKILDFPDLSVDGTFPMGAAVTAMLILKLLLVLALLPALFGNAFAAGPKARTLTDADYAPIDALWAELDAVEQEAQTQSAQDGPDRTLAAAQAVAEALGKKLDLQMVNLEEYEVNVDVVAKVPKQLAEKYNNFRPFSVFSRLLPHQTPAKGKCGSQKQNENCRSRFVHIKDAPFVSVTPFFLFLEEPASFPFSFRGRFIENLTVLQDSSRIHFH